MQREHPDESNDNMKHEHEDELGHAYNDHIN
jgi:hypothetical protein